jgi:hypothetical protein
LIGIVRVKEPIPLQVIGQFIVEKAKGLVNNIPIDWIVDGLIGHIIGNEASEISTEW